MFNRGVIHTSKQALEAAREILERCKIKHLGIVSRSQFNDIVLELTWWDDPIREVNSGNWDLYEAALWEKQYIEKNGRKVGLENARNEISKENSINIKIYMTVAK